MRVGSGAATRISDLLTAQTDDGKVRRILEYGRHVDDARTFGQRRERDAPRRSVHAPFVILSRKEEQFLAIRIELARPRDRPAQVPAEIVESQFLGDRRKEAATVELVVTEKFPQRAVIFRRAAPRRKVDLRAARAPIFGAVGAGRDLHFANEIHADVVRDRSDVAAVLIVPAIHRHRIGGRAQPVDVVSTDAAIRHPAAIKFVSCYGHARHDHQQRHQVSPVQR